MDKPPRYGEAVLVPWGADLVPAEVIDIYGNDHALVRLPVQGASDETLDEVPARFAIRALQPFPHGWRPVASRAGKPAAGADAATAWYVDAERNGDSAQVEVRLSGTAGAILERGGHLPRDSEEAVSTHGRSAVVEFGYRYRLPRVIVIGSQGLFTLDD